MTTTYTFEQLKEDVRKEAEALRMYATKEELCQLDFEKFDPQLSDQCIYGQMTGVCASKRAHQLISKCCSVYVVNDTFDPTISFEADVKNIQFTPKQLNKIRESEVVTRLMYLSAIEAYILLYEAKNANLIAFLKGETDTLEL